MSGKRRQPRQRSITIADVARRAGVSVGTVSNYLNGTKRQTEATRRAVREAMDELGYEPNINARSLRAQTTRTIGLILPNIVNPFFTDLAAVTEQRAWDRGYQVLLCSSLDDVETEATQVRSLHQRRVDGALIAATAHSEFREPSRAVPFPAVFLDRALTGRPSVATDNLLGGRLAAEHLVSLGHRRIGLVIGDPSLENIQDRLTGAEQLLAEHGLRVAPQHRFEGPQSLETGLKAVSLWDQDEPPTAVFATNDIVALGLWRALQRRGLEVPGDVSLVGFDDVRWIEITGPELTTVRQDVDLLANRALDLLLEWVEAAPDDPPQAVQDTAHDLLDPTLVVRGSTSPVVDARPSRRQRQQDARHRS